MKKFIATVVGLHTNPTGDRFSQEVIDELLRDQPTLPIRARFGGEVIGHTTKFSKDVCEFNLVDSKIPEPIKHLFLVPGAINIKYHLDEDGHKVIDKAKFTELSITGFSSGTLSAENGEKKARIGGSRGIYITYNENQLFIRRPTMFQKITSVLKNPEFQRNVAHTAGNIVSLVASAVIANVVHRAIDKGIDIAMDKIQCDTNVTVE